MGSPIPDPLPRASRAERLYAQLEGSFSDYHSPSGMQRELLRELVAAVRREERALVLDAVRAAAAGLAEAVEEQLPRLSR